MALAPKPSSVLWPIDAIRDAAQAGLANISTDSGGVPRYIPMVFQTPDGVAPSFALAAAAQGLEAQPILAPDRIEIAGQSRAMDLGYHMPLRFYGPAGSFRRISAAGSCAEISIRRRSAAKSSSSALRPRARRTRSRRHSIALRRARKCSRLQSAISWPATDWRGRHRPAGSTRPRRLRFPLS